jgi:1-deoxy-D-xylulose-5-phosphate reductoisomerase
MGRGADRRGNIAQLAEDAIRLNAEVAVTAYEDRLDDLRAALAGSGVEAAAGEGALLEAADRPADWIMSAIVGAAGLAPGFRRCGTARRWRWPTRKAS